MRKDFDDFKGIDDETLSRLAESAARTVGIDLADADAKITSGQLAELVGALSFSYVNATLRAYHEWVNADRE